MTFALTTIPLRLVVTTRCNGRCPFCHHEGAYSDTKMSESDFIACFEAAAMLGITRVSITGGEPTMLDNLSDMISAVSNKFPHIRINVTTNGFKLSQLGRSIQNSISECNLSVTSFKDEIYRNYQNVEPLSAFENLKNFPAAKKNLNIVVTDINIDEIQSIIDFALACDISVVLMFELKRYSEADYALHRKLFRILKLYGKPFIQVKHIPEICYMISDKLSISVKYSLLNCKYARSLCISCQKKANCYERVCAIRVYPDQAVTPCLTQHILCKNGNIHERITEAYSLIGDTLAQNHEYHLPEWFKEAFDVPPTGVFEIGSGKLHKEREL